MRIDYLIRVSKDRRAKTRSEFGEQFTTVHTVKNGVLVYDNTDDWQHMLATLGTNESVTVTPSIRVHFYGVGHRHSRNDGGYVEFQTTNIRHVREALARGLDDLEKLMTAPTSVKVAAE